MLASAALIIPTDIDYSRLYWSIIGPITSVADCISTLYHYPVLFL